MRIYLKEIEIKGWPGKFQKICSIDKSNGLFKITTPDYVVKGDLVRTGYVIADTMKEAEAEFHKEVTKFKMKNADFKTVILYDIEERGSYKDGSGAGFIFKWGVFRRVELANEHPQYFYERGFVNKKRYECDGWDSDLNKWKQIDWSQEREDNFMVVSQKLESLFNILMQCDFTQSLIKQLGFGESIEQVNNTK